MLKPYRVVDLSADGIFCSYLLAHLGAEVICVEPPGGSPMRRVPPLADGESLWWQAYGRGKTSIELDVFTPEGKRALEPLIASADFLIESFSNADLAAAGLDYASLAAVNPALIVVSITPFGRTGPKADWPATDLTVWASCGAHALAGDADRAPVRTSVPQSFLHAGADAAGAALIALQARHRDGRGQHVDVSAQQSSAQAALSANLAAPNNTGVTVERQAGGLAGIFPIQLTWPCADGYVAITLLFGPAFTEPNRRFLTWVHEGGACTAEEAAMDWGERIAAMATGGAAPEDYFALCKKIETFTRARTQSALFEEGLARGVYIAPTLNIAGLLEETHFHARGFWHTDGNADGRRLPGAFAKLSNSPLQLPAPAPAPGAGEITSRPVPAAPTGKDDSPPLTGLKVLDFMWVIAGPFCTRVLADYGATVIKVESGTRIEPARASPPFKDGEISLEHGTPFANFNAGKLGMTIDPSNPAGRELILDLVRWADVVTESFSPKAMRAWGLDYDSLREVNPGIIMLSSCLMGQTGPRALVPGYGNMAAALTGYYDLTGWQDRSPAGPYLAYTDGVAPRFMLLSLLGALEHRRQTGEGQHIDVSQAEAAIHLLAPAVLDHETNGHVWSRMGNRDLAACPHGVYPAAGDDVWVAIACDSDERWQTLAGIIGRQDLRDLTLDERREREDELDAAIAHWSTARPADETESTLIGAGVPAHRVQNSAGCAEDPQLAHREHFITLPHSSVGDMVVEGTRFKLSGTPARMTHASPELGEHNVQVLTDILGYDDGQMANVFASLAME